MSKRIMKSTVAAALVFSFVNLLTASSNVTPAVNSTSQQTTTQASLSITTKVITTSLRPATNGIVRSDISNTSVTPQEATNTDLIDSQINNENDTTTKLHHTTDQYNPTAPSVQSISSDNSTQRLTTLISSSSAIRPTDKHTSLPDSVPTAHTKDNTTGQPGDVKAPSTSNSTGKEGTIEGKDNDNNIHTNIVDGAKQTSLANRKGIVIGVGCVLSVIVLVVLVFLYKMCQKKAPASENTGLKVSAPTKDSVQLLSVKTATPYSDAKRASSNQMEFLEC